MDKVAAPMEIKSNIKLRNIDETNPKKEEKYNKIKYEGLPISLSKLYGYRSAFVSVHLCNFTLFP